MDLDQELEGFADYANDDVRTLFNRFNSDEDRRWAWFVLSSVIQYFSQADHQVKYDKINKRLVIRVDLCSSKQHFFHLAKDHRKRQPFAGLWFPDSSKLRPLLSNNMWWLNSQINKTKEDIIDRLNYYKDIIVKNNILISGNSLLPKNSALLSNNADLNSSNLSSKEIMENSLNTILYGPPGTGKTYHTINKALEIIAPDFYSSHKNDGRTILKNRFDELCKENKIVMTTFHQSYSYEDFVEGLSAESKDGQLVYGIKKGTFKTICENAEKSPNEKFVLIIDEINRGNASNIFGELITLIEDSKRAGKDEALSVTLPYSKESFSVPSNLYIIGTMNTADRSLTQIDTALRRRFHFEEMMPQPELLDSIVIDSIEIEVGKLLRCLNARIEALYDREHTLGHAFFMELKDKNNIETLAKIFKNKIIPLLQEYFFDDWGKIQLILGDQVIKEKPQFSNFATPNINNLVIPKAYDIVIETLKEPDTYITMYKNCLSA
jgi:5-methylcytosine-specific restriction protein B